MGIACALRKADSSWHRLRPRRQRDDVCPRPAGTDDPAETLRGHVDAAGVADEQLQLVEVSLHLALGLALYRGLGLGGDVVREGRCSGRSGARLPLSWFTEMIWDEVGPTC